MAYNGNINQYRFIVYLCIIKKSLKKRTISFFQLIKCQFKLKQEKGEYKKTFMVTIKDWFEFLQSTLV